VKRAVIILSAFALIASSCGNKKQTGYENIPADSIQVITENCLVVKYPEEQNFDDEESDEAQSYFTFFDDFIYYSSETNVRFRKLGIDFVEVEKRYVSFALNNGENHIIDTKEQSVWVAFLYKKGKEPIPVDVHRSDWKTVADYLQMEESEIIKRIEAAPEHINEDYIDSENSLTIEQIEINLIKSYKRILSNRFDSDDIPWDRIESDIVNFREKLFNYTVDYPATLTYNFDSLKNDIFIVTSEDNLFRIYSWDTWRTGSMHDFENIFQFKSGNKIYYKKIYAIEENDYVPFYSQIFTVKADDKTYYLAVNNGIYSNKDASQSIKVFTIENNTLNDTLKLFKTKTKLYNEINVGFDFFSVVDRPERPLRLIKYDPNKKIVSIPIVLENGKVTDRYILYQFKGEYFEHILTQK
jgi:hypothetical protein